MGPRCTILSDESSHTSGIEPECTVCLQPWSSHPKGKQINKKCKFCQQQALGNIASDEMDPLEDNDIQAWLMCIMQENHAIKAQLTELVHQLLLQQPPAAQASQQGTPTRNPHPELLTAEEHFPSAQATSLSHSPPSWLQPSKATPGEPSSDQLAVHLHSTIHTTALECHASLPQLPPHRKDLLPSLAYTHSLFGLPHSAWGHHKQYQVPVSSS